MNIIIEGPDAAGKTTLAEKIKAKYPFMQYVHSTANTPNDYDYHSYLLTKELGDISGAASVGVVLIAIVLLLNTIAKFIAKKLSKGNI